MKSITAGGALAMVVLGTLAGCADTPDPTGDRARVAPPGVVDSAPADTRVLDLGDGTAVWLTAGRVGRARTGGSCRERGIELRKGDSRVTVPLLYTLDIPVVVDGKVVASLASDCVSGQNYSIDAVTGQPTKLERRTR